MPRFSKIAFLFPGQGAQYTGMAKDFFDTFPVAKGTFQEADDLLGRSLSTVVFQGPDELLTETKNSQLGILCSQSCHFAIDFKAISSIEPQRMRRT